MLTLKGKSSWGLLGGLVVVGALSATPAHAANITLMATLRDFCGIGYIGCGSVLEHPDFERPDVIGVDDQGALKTTLGAGGVPELLNASSPTITSQDSFSKWYTSNSLYNQTLVTPFQFVDIGGGLYQYDNQSYFPLDGLLINDRPSLSQCDYAGNFAACNHNFGFTTQVSTTFTYKEGAAQTFTFDGDDDAWVFINNTLAMDLGGVHSKETKTINLDDPALKLLLGLTDGGVYSFDFFGAERHTVESHVKITTSVILDTPPNPAVPEPATLTFLGSGLAAAFYRRRRKSQNV